MEPEDLIPGAGATQIAWQVSPGSLLLAPGATGKLKLRAIYDDGTHVPVELPLDASPVVVGDLVTVARAATGLSVTAGNTIGTAFVTVDGLGALPVEPASIQVAELKPGVMAITNDHLMFPLPDVPASIALDVDTMTRWTGIGDAGIGPFGWEDILTRFSSVDGIVRYPVVLTGPAPAAGTVIVSVEGSDVMGEVVAPPGQPIMTATWNGIPVALVTVQIGDLRDVFASYSFDLDDQQVVAAGYPMRLLDAGDGPEPLTLETLDGDAGSDWLREQQNQSAGGRGMMPELLPMEGETGGMKCKPDPSAGLYARFDSTVNQPTGSASAFQFRVMDGNVQALVAPFFGVPLTNMKGSVYVQPASKGVKIDCTVWDKAWALPLIPKPLGLAFQPMVALYVKITGEATVKLNRLADVDYQVNFGFGARAGFSYDVVNGVQPVWEYVPPTADGKLSWDTLASTLGLDRDGTSPIALTADVGLGAYAGLQLGVQMLSDLQPLLDSIAKWPVISGWLRDGIAQFADNLKISFIDTRIGIKGAAIFGNTQAVLDQSKSENQIALLALAEGKFTTEKIDKYFRILGMFTPRVEIKLFPDQKQGIASLYRHLEASKATVTVDGKKVDDKPDDITVHPDEQLTIELPVAHKPENLTSYSSILDPPLTSAGMYRDDGALAPPDQQPFTVTAAGSTITLKHQFTKAECEGAFADQNTFIVVPYNQFAGLDSPGWAGQIGVTCTKPTLAVVESVEDMTPVTEVKLTDKSTRTIGVVATELRNPLEFKAETEAAWLTLEPATGSLQPAEEKGKPADLQLTLKADCSAGGEELFGRQETTVKVSETGSPKVIDADPIELPVVVDCSESLKLMPPDLQLDYDHTQQEVTFRAQVNGEQLWEIGTHSAWLKLTTAGESGALPSGTSVHSFTVAVDQAAVTCDAQSGTVQGSYKINVLGPNGATAVDGTVAYRCHKPELTITPTSATLSTGQERKLTVGLRYATGAATLGVSTAGDIPVKVTPTTAQLANGATTVLTVTPQCTDQGTYSGSIVVTASGVELPTSADITVRCDVNVTVTPAQLSGPSGTATIAWQGFEGGINYKVASLPNWLALDGGQPGTFLFSDDPSGSDNFGFTVVGQTERTCGQPAFDRETDITFVAEAFDTDSGIQPFTKTVHYTFHSDATPECPKGSRVARGEGDPHLYSFDGYAFDAQLLGDYVFVEPTTADPTLPRVVARLEPTISGGHTAGSVTSITALAVEVGGSRVEVYGRPTLKLFREGVPLTATSFEPVAIGPGASIARNGNQVTITAGTVTVQLAYSAGFTMFDIKVTAPHLAPLRGFLGSPDGNPANDRDGADGTSHDPFGPYGDARTALLDFGASWRITDPAATPLSAQGSDYFNAKTPDEIDPAELALAEQQVRDRLPALLPPLCTVTSVSDYTIAALALEHWAFPDMGLDATIARWTGMLCSYAVSGTVSASLNGDTQMVAGLAVTVDMPGAASCTATTGTNGRYACTLRPLTPAEAGGFTPPASGGPTATVTVSRPDGDPVGTGTASFDELATQGLTLSATGDVSADPSVLRAVILHGTLVRDGAPMAGPITIPVHQYNGSAYGGQRDVVVYPAADGSYSATLLLAQATNAIGVDLSRSTSFRTVPYNSPNWQVKPSGITDAAFDWDDTGYKLVFGGTVSQALLDAGAADTTLKIRANVARQDGSVSGVDVFARSLSCTDQPEFTSPMRLINCFDGTSFGGEITLPAPATSVEVLVSSPALAQPQFLRFDVKTGATPLVLFGQGGDGVRAASVLITGVTEQVRDDYNFPWNVEMIQSDHSREWGFGYSVRPWEQFGWDATVTGVEYIWYPRPGSTGVGIELNGSIFGSSTRAEASLEGATSWPVRVATYDLTARAWDDQSVLVRFESYSNVWAKDTRVTVTGLVDGEPSSDPVEIFYDDNTDHRTRVIGTAWVSNNDSRFEGWFAFPAGTNGVRVETVDGKTGASATVDHGIDEVIDPLAFHILTIEANLVTSAGPIDLRLHARLLTETDDGDVEWWSGNVTVTNGELNLAVLAPLHLAGFNDRVRLVLWPGYGDDEWIWFSPPADEAQRWAEGGSYSVWDEWADAPSYEMSFEQTLSSALRETEWEHAVVTVTGLVDGEPSSDPVEIFYDDNGADSEYTEGDVGDWQAGDSSGDWTLPELTLRQRVWVPRVISTVHVEISFPTSDHDHTLERDVAVTDGGIVQLADIASYLLDIEAGLAGGGSYPGPWVAGFAFPLNPEPTDPDEDRMWRQRVEAPAGTDRVLLVGWLPRHPETQVIEAWVEWTGHSTSSGASWEVELDPDVAGYGAGLRLEYSEPQGRAAAPASSTPDDPADEPTPDETPPAAQRRAATPTPEPDSEPEPTPSPDPTPSSDPSPEEAVAPEPDLTPPPSTDP